MQDAEVLRLKGRNANLDARIQQGLKAGVEHGKAKRELGALLAYEPRVKARYEEAMGELESKVAQGDEDPTLEFWRLQPVIEQVNVPIYYERGGSRIPITVCHEILLDDALEASHARSQRYKRDASSSLVVAEPIVAFGPHTVSLSPTVEVQGDAYSLVMIVTLLNSIVVFHYPIFDVSIVKDVVINDELQNQISMEETVHDDTFDTTLLDRL
ncbi:hypothetical protein Tco_0627282 [Tanacetum coccineum]|uniref:Uncharacterized protein n=1 Tax=Tanacetum coccineum TaxID=301880 RepID=A0ABQ4WM20_9ASTR